MLRPASAHLPPVQLGLQPKSPVPDVARLGLSLPPLQPVARGLACVRLREEPEPGL